MKKLIIILTILILPNITLAALNDGLIGYWSLDRRDTVTTSDTSGTVFDRSGNGNNGTIINFGSISIARIFSKIGQGLTFDGFDDSIINTTLNLGSTNKATVSMWLKWNSYANNDDLAFEYTSNMNTNVGGFIIDPNSSSCSGNQMEFSMTISSTFPSGYHGICSARPTANVWHHYTVIFDRTTGVNNGITFYLNGTEASITRLYTGDMASSNFFTNGGAYIMSRGGASLFGAGSIDDVRVYNRTLSANEIRILYRLGLMQGSR